MMALCGLFLVFGIVAWIGRGKQSPEITRYTAVEQMGGRVVLAMLGGVALLVVLFGGLGAMIGYPIDGPPDLAKQARAAAVVDSVLGTSGNREAQVLALMPVVFAVCLLLAVCVASLFI